LKEAGYTKVVKDPSEVNEDNNLSNVRHKLVDISETRKRNISSSSCSNQRAGPLVDPFWSHASRSLFNGLAWSLLPFGV
jgi:hypothetical protein